MTYDPQRYSTPSSGDSEADRAAIEEHIKSKMRIDEGLCPNHPERPVALVRVDDYERNCPDCGFSIFTSTIHVGPR